MIPSKIIFLKLSVTILLLLEFFQQPFAQKILSKGEREKEWHEAKFGMFIHWGLYAIPAQGEWYMRNAKIAVADYAKLAEKFNPTQFDADKWVSIAKSAGMKYLVITSKHHDGFALFGSKASNYNMVDATPYHKDVVKALAAACQKQGLKFGIYYSTIADWHHPGGQAGCPHWDSAQNGDLDTYMKNIAIPQITELTTQYGPIFEFWFDNDGSKGINAQRAAPIIELLKEHQPNVMKDDRLVEADFTTEEQHISRLRPKGNWEACITTSGNWGYKRTPAKSLSTLVKTIIDIADKGGNILLNVGPDEKGNIPDDNIERLTGIGRWIHANEEAFYGTTNGPFSYLPFGKNTAKGNTVYLHILKMPSDNKIMIPMPEAPLKVYLVAHKTEKLPTTYTNGKLTITIPASLVDSIATTVAVVCNKPLPIIMSAALDKPVTCSGISERKPALAVDSFPNTRWHSKDSTGWFAVDLLKPTTIDALRVDYRYGKMQKFALQYLVGANWKTIFDGEDMPNDDYEKQFPAVTAQHFRLLITKNSGVMNMASFELFQAMN